MLSIWLFLKYKYAMVSICVNKKGLLVSIPSRGILLVLQQEHEALISVGGIT